MTTHSVPTFCRVCEPACGLVADVEDGALIALRPDREHPVTRGFACHKGIAGLDVHRDPDRLDHPLRRTPGGGFERIGWDDAVDGIATRLRGIVERHGPGAVASYLGNPTAFNTLAGPAASAFFAQLGARRAFSSGTQDCANKFAGSEAVFGSSTIHPIPDLRHTDFFLCLGANPRVSHMSFVSIPDPMQVLRDARARGARIVFVNPRRIESVAPSTGEWLPIRPDTDVYLLAALLAEIDRLGRFDVGVIARHGRHVDALRAFVRRFPAKRAAAVTGIDAERIRALARAFSEAPSASVHMSTGVNMGRQGTLAYWLVHMLSFVTGNLDRRGGNLLSVGFYRSAKAGRRRFEDGFVDTEFGTLRRGALPGNLLAHAIEESREPVRALFVLAGNPLLSIGGEERLRRAFERLELLVCVDLYRNATGETAHYLLPATDMFERADVNLTGLGLQHQPWVQYSEAVVEPRGERREEWWIFARLAQALGLRSSLDAPGGDPWSRIDHMLASRGLSLAALRERPRGVELEDGLEPGRFYTEHLQTADGRVDCCPDAFAPALAAAERIYEELLAEGPARLQLITRRDPWMHNSWYANLPRLRRGAHATNPLWVHPDDLAERRLHPGGRARLWNEHGAIEVSVEADTGLVRGVVALAHGGGHARAPGLRVAQAAPGVNPNALLPIGPGSFEALSSQAFMTGVPVELAALPGEGPPV
ncbi:MAG TPA: molybdopterin-dependent oxidoreductase [Myxococcota bacterium]|nr:molybdopterin-dependent oxidoreductase [Myxococcota bacterium]